MLITNVLGREVRVEYGDRDPTSGALGRSDSSTDRILIWGGMSDAGLQSMLGHEWLHLVSEYLGLELTEKQVLGLEVALFQAGFRVPVIDTAADQKAQ